jgi:hypothetical protein
VSLITSRTSGEEVKSFVGIAAVAMRRRSSNDNGCRCEGSTEFRKHAGDIGW